MVERQKEKTEVLTILNKYKKTLIDFINSLDIEFLYIVKQVSKKLCNIIFNIQNFLIKLKLNKKFLNKL